MEYIHKAKAEKTRTKVLSDQMEARRVKNKVCRFLSLIWLHRKLILLDRPLASVGQFGYWRRDRRSSPSSTRMSRSDYDAFFFTPVSPLLPSLLPSYIFLSRAILYPMPCMHIYKSNARYHAHVFDSILYHDPTVASFGRRAPSP